MPSPRSGPSLITRILGSQVRLDVVHKRFVDDSWLLFTQYREALALTRREYDDVVRAAQLHVAAAEVATTQQNPVPPEIVADHADDTDADSLESF